MTTAAPTTALATIQPAFTDAERLVLAGDVVHRVGTERDQVLRHPRLRRPGGLLRPCLDS